MSQFYEKADSCKAPKPNTNGHPVLQVFIEGWAFPSDKSRSGHIELSGLEHMFRKVARKLGIPDSLKLYCARHTFGTVAMAETRNPGLVKDVMGHGSLNTTMGYLHPEVLQIKQVIDRRNQEKEDGQRVM